jgi:DNA-binding PadR family transcriptional regulator
MAHLWETTIDIRKLYSYSFVVPRRKAGSILPLELSLLHAVIELGAQGSDAYGFAIARLISAGRPAQALTSHGTLYKALGRLSERGLLVATWEAAELAEAEGRPRRRLYSITAEGAATAARSIPKSHASSAASPRATTAPVLPILPVFP